MKYIFVKKNKKIKLTSKSILILSSEFYKVDLLNENLNKKQQSIIINNLNNDIYEKITRKVKSKEKIIEVISYSKEEINFFIDSNIENIKYIDEIYFMQEIENIIPVNIDNDIIFKKNNIVINIPKNKIKEEIKYESIKLNKRNKIKLKEFKIDVKVINPINLILSMLLILNLTYIYKKTTLKQTNNEKISKLSFPKLKRKRTRIIKEIKQDIKTNKNINVFLSKLDEIDEGKIIYLNIDENKGFVRIESNIKTIKNIFKESRIREKNMLIDIRKSFNEK